MQRNPNSKNIQNTFSSFDSGGADKTSKRLRLGFKICMYLMAGYPIGLVLENKFDESVIGMIGTGLAFLAALSWIVSIIFVCLLGAHSYGKNKGSNGLATSLGLVLGKTFKYILLPALIITVLTIIWALVTEQPTFQ